MEEEESMNVLVVRRGGEKEGQAKTNEPAESLGEMAA